VPFVTQRCHIDRVFYPRTTAEVLALDIVHDNGGQHVTAGTDKLAGPY
jgi:hypothetical protein